MRENPSMGVGEKKWDISRVWNWAPLVVTDADSATWALITQ